MRHLINQVKHFNLKTAMEKCYRDIQNRGQIAGLNLLEIFILLGIPLLLFPIFTLVGASVAIIFLIEMLMYCLFRLAARISTFDYGLVSFICYWFIWPRRLSAFALDERQYLKDLQDASSQEHFFEIGPEDNRKRILAK